MTTPVSGTDRLETDETPSALLQNHEADGTKSLQNDTAARVDKQGTALKAKVHPRGPTKDSKHDPTQDLPPTCPRMHRFTLYETHARFFLVGADITDRYYRVLKIDRASAGRTLSLFEDANVYTKKELTQLLSTIDDGNQATGGLRVKYSSFWGVVGFIYLTESYYMLLITKRQQIAMLGGHYIYQIDGTELVPIPSSPSVRAARDRSTDEARFLTILQNLDLTKCFYFSYSYDITRPLQHNIIRERKGVSHDMQRPPQNVNPMFMWNEYLMQPAISQLGNVHEWCLPIMHGFIDQSSIDVFGRLIYITIIGRRSRFFAGARFLKRGINDQGHVANDVETEQIVSELLTTSFHAPGPRLFSSPTYTSYVHHRGSIPLHWTQDSSGVTPKPDIDVSLPDPFYQHTALHFDDLFERYGCPIYVLNLIKARERTPRESKLLHEFKHAIDYLNQFLPIEKRIIYKAFDMSRAAKTRGGDVIGNLEAIAQEVIDQTGFFHNGDAIDHVPGIQNGVARTNCVDCLDRTNAAQFVIGKRAFGYQLKALGVIPTPDMQYDSDAINIFTHMFHDHGDTIAVQYGGSHLVNTMATYRKINHWQSQSRDMVESFKRYYHNSFLDAQRQEAYNLFLGNYAYAPGQPMLWELTTDYYLHNANPRAWLARRRARKSYTMWYTPEHLETRRLPPPPDHHTLEACKYGITEYDDYWLEYYRPFLMSSFLKLYAFRMTSSHRFLPERPLKDSTYDFSPFVRRQDLAKPVPDSPEKRSARKGVTIVAPDDHDSSHQDRYQATTVTWRDRPMTYSPGNMTSATTLGSGNSLTNPRETSARAIEKSLVAQMTMNQILETSLNPSVAPAEQAEYERYISHPLNLPLVVSMDLSSTQLNSAGGSGPSTTTLDFVDYIESGSGEWRGDGNAPWDVTEVDIADFEDFVEMATIEDALKVSEEDLGGLDVLGDGSRRSGGARRYKAYRQWLVRGKSLFKLSKIDQEHSDAW